MAPWGPRRSLNRLALLYARGGNQDMTDIRKQLKEATTSELLKLLDGEEKWRENGVLGSHPLRDLIQQYADENEHVPFPTAILIVWPMVATEIANRWRALVKPPADHYVEVIVDDMELGVWFDYTPGDHGNMWGDPDSWRPQEDAEADVGQVVIIDKDWLADNDHLIEGAILDVYPPEED